MKYKIEKNEILIKFEHSEINKKEIIKQWCTGYQYNPLTKAWSIELTPWNIEILKEKGLLPQDLFLYDTTKVEYDTAVQPYSHQIEMTSMIVNAFEADRNVFLLAETGTGKTKAVIDAILHLKKQYSALPVLILVPKPLVFVWQKEFEKHGHNELYYFTAAKNDLPSECTQKDIAGKIIVSNYDYFSKYSTKFEEVRFGIVVCDESHLLKNGQTNRHKAVHKLNTKMIILMTGTPYGNRNMDIYSQLKLLGLHGSFAGFQSRYLYKTVFGYESIRTEELMRSLQHITKFYTKEMCLDLPPKVYETVTLDTSPEQKRLFQKYRADFIESSEGIEAVREIERINIFRQISSGFLYREEIDVDCVKYEYLESIDFDVPTIIWYNYDRELERILDTLDKRYKNEIAIANGDFETKGSVEAFEKGRYRILVANYKTLSYGVTLNRAKRVIFFSPTYSSIERIQAEDRSHRIGQTSSVQYITLLCGKFEEYVHKVCNEKIEQNEKIKKIYNFILDNDISI